MRLPVSTDAIPGAFMEAVLAHVHDAEVLRTYDYIDVLDSRNSVGWSIKSTKSTTPVTWKRAKIANKEQLLADSFQSEAGTQELGRQIIKFCNDHARQSYDLYALEEIGYSRLVMFPNGTAMYFERLLCTRDEPDIFDPADFNWSWSAQRVTPSKEQLRALNGYHRVTGKKWWAWHGLGENQLHFTGEKAWWPGEGADHATTFKLPSVDARLSFDRLLDLLEDM